MMDKQIQLTLAYTLIVLGALLGGAYLWGTSTIIADTTPPVIDEAASTSGPVAYSDPLGVVLFVEENLGMQEATAELFNVGLLGLRGSLIQKCTMGQASKSGTTYKYLGTFTATLTADKEYILLYTATDAAGHKDTYQTRIEMVNLEAEVYVNDVKVEGTGSTVYVNSLKLTFKVVITQGAGNLDKVYCVVGDETIDNFEKTYEGYGIENWVDTYTLPGDGSYEFVVIVKDTAGETTQIASFAVELGTEQRWPLIVGTLGVLGVATVYFSMEPEPKKKR